MGMYFQEKNNNKVPLNMEFLTYFTRKVFLQHTVVEVVFGFDEESTASVHIRIYIHTYILKDTNTDPIIPAHACACGLIIS